MTMHRLLDKVYRYCSRWRQTVVLIAIAMALSAVSTYLYTEDMRGRATIVLIVSVVILIVLHLIPERLKENASRVMHKILRSQLAHEHWTHEQVANKESAIAHGSRICVMTRDLSLEYVEWCEPEPEKATILKAIATNLVNQVEYHYLFPFDTDARPDVFKDRIRRVIRKIKGREFDRKLLKRALDRLRYRFVEPSTVPFDGITVYEPDESGKAITTLGYIYINKKGGTHGNDDEGKVLVLPVSDLTLLDELCKAQERLCGRSLRRRERP